MSDHKDSMRGEREGYSGMSSGLPRNFAESVGRAAGEHRRLRETMRYSPDAPAAGRSGSVLPILFAIAALAVCLPAPAHPYYKGGPDADTQTERGRPMSDLPALPVIQPGRYRHYKGQEYEVVGVVRHSETLEPLVLYRPLYADTGWWVRPFSMFQEPVEHAGRVQPRFAPIPLAPRGAAG